jgi:hypothetical protein
MAGILTYALHDDEGNEQVARPVARMKEQVGDEPMAGRFGNREVGMGGERKARVTAIFPVVSGIVVAVEVDGGDVIGGSIERMPAAPVHVLVVNGRPAQAELGAEAGITGACGEH